VAAVHQTLDQLRPSFPQGVELTYPLDTTPFVRLSMTEVAKTLAEAIVLVFLIMYLFPAECPGDAHSDDRSACRAARHLRACLAAAGYSLNSLTMFGMVLAIGLLVDDAIVVVENVERVMENGTSVAQRGDAPAPWTRSAAR